MSKTLNPSVSNLPETQSAIPASTFSAYSTKTRRAKEHGNEFLNLLFRLRTDLGAALSRLSLSAQEHDSGLWNVFVQRTLYVWTLDWILRALNTLSVEKVTTLGVETFTSVQFSPLTVWIVGVDMRNDSAEILFQSFLQEALVSSSGMGRDVETYRSPSPSAWNTSMRLLLSLRGCLEFWGLKLSLFVCVSVHAFLFFCFFGWPVTILWVFEG